MSISSLTAKHRPQTFAEVAGQQAVKTILSRAAAEDRVAPAYLFSGTRGVGKTTIARIFAKALNCVEAPTAEPCNVCHRCRQATAGVFPDIIEIDGASHNKVDDARSLKEDIGYAPLEGRYKVIIIDEAHMLTVQAFNALLKTLEEPPPRVTFIMATTEVRKFPATIISRCQHYVFQMLSQQELVAHLADILGRESVPYDPGALEIIAKRGAGSVRDSMSLLGQALALGNGELREDDVRAFLGLAGQDVFFSLLQGVHDRDLVAVEQVLRGVLDQGLDLGFFLRELAACWRNMFLLRQAGEPALPLLNLSEHDARAWLEWAGRFSPAQIHASWQMTLEGQRRVMSSMEPAMALELLLLNLASLPDLLDLESLGSSRPAPASSGTAPARGGPSGGTAGGGPRGAAVSGRPASARRAAPQASAPQTSHSQAPHPQTAGQHAPAPQTPAASGTPHVAPGPSAPVAATRPRSVTAPNRSGAREQRPRPGAQPAAGMSAPGGDWQPGPGGPEPPPPGDDPEPAGPESLGFDESFDADAGEPGAAQEPFTPSGPQDWRSFRDHLREMNGASGFSFANLRGVRGNYADGLLTLTCPNAFMSGRLRGGSSGQALLKNVREYFGPGVRLRVEVEEGIGAMTNQQRLQEIEKNPAVRRVKAAFDASVRDVAPRDRS